MLKPLVPTPNSAQCFSKQADRLTVASNLFWQPECHLWLVLDAANTLGLESCATMPDHT